MKRVLALLLCLVLAASTLAACDLPEELHVHTYNYESVTGDGTGHWYEPTCDCEDAPIKKLAHNDANNDGACDVCKFTDHTHTYAEGWTSDCTNHWNAADCGHVVAGANVSAHVDENTDGKCDVCNYVIEDIHTHYYANEYTSDSEYHWFAPLCEHADAEVTKEAHKVNAAGDCTVCGAKVKNVDETNIVEVINAAIANNYKVVNGTVVFDELVFGTETVDGIHVPVLESGKEDVVYYILGDEQSYVFYKSFTPDGEFLGAEHQWYERISDDEVFGAVMYVGEYELQRNAGDTQFLYGYNYMPGVLLAASDDTTSLAVTVYELYNLATSDGASSFEAMYDEEERAHGFMFNYTLVNVTEGTDEQGNKTVDYAVEYFEVMVAFSFDDNYVMDNAYIFVDSYRNLEGVDNDLSYNPETGEVTLFETANATSYYYSVSQTSGERTYITPYTKEALMPKSFELEAEGFDGETLTVDSGASVKFYLSDIYPVTASAAFINADDLKVSFVNNDTEATGILWGEYGMYYDTYNGSIGIYTRDAGTYTVTVEYLDMVKTFTVIVEEEEGSDIVAGENEFVVETTDTYCYADLVTFIASNGAGYYTFNLPAGLGFWSEESFDNFEAPEHDVLGGGDAEPWSITVAIAENAEYKFYIGATTKDSWLISYEYEAADVSGDDNEGDDPVVDYNVTLVAGKNTVYFSAEEVNADTALRTLTVEAAGDYNFAAGNLFVEGITDAEGNSIAKNTNLTFTLTAGTYTVKFGMLSMFGVEADTAYSLNIENKSAPIGGGDGDDDDEGETTQPDGTEANPFIIDLGAWQFVSVNSAEPIYVLVKAGVTAVIYFDGYFMLDTVPMGTYVTPDEDTVYTVYANSLAGATGVIEGVEDYIPGGDVTEAPEDALVGSYFVNGYEAMIYYDADASVYYLNVWGEGFDNYYTFVAIFNDDGTATLTLTVDADHWMATTDPDALKLDGTDITVEVPAGDDIGGGDVTEAPEDALVGDYVVNGYEANIYYNLEFTTYYFNIWGEVDGASFDNTYVFVATFNDDGTATLTLTFVEGYWMNTGADDALALDGTDITVEVPAGDDIGGGDVTEAPEEALVGDYTYEGNDASIYAIEGVYYFNIWGEGFDCYYTFVATFNDDGTATLELSFNPDFYLNALTTDILELDGKTITVELP